MFFSLPSSRARPCSSFFGHGELSFPVDPANGGCFSQSPEGRNGNRPPHPIFWQTNNVRPLGLTRSQGPYGRRVQGRPVSSASPHLTRWLSPSLPLTLEASVSLALVFRFIFLSQIYPRSSCVFSLMQKDVSLFTISAVSNVFFFSLGQTYPITRCVPQYLSKSLAS